MEEAEKFLSRIRERGGLFILRTGDYFGFFHRTFQEYFVARHLLNAIKQQPVEGIKDLVDRACQRDDLWREPFLLAVAYQSTVDEKIAGEIIRELLTSPMGASQKEREHNLLLAAESLIETKPLTLDPILEKQIAHRLILFYEEAQRNNNFKICDEIEKAMRRWLLSLPKEAYRPPLLAVLYETIADTSQVARQRATLTLLTMIAQQLASCPPNVFETLIPPLLALAGLPAVGDYQPSSTVPVAPDLDIADLALTALSCLGKRGPAGSLLLKVRHYFNDHSEHLCLLARYSLECGTLLTLTVVPLAKENYQRYEKAVGQWIELRDAHKTSHVSDREIGECLTIHQVLLVSAEEVYHPTASHLLTMLQLSARQPDQPWQKIWQGYLLQQLTSNQYMSYQESILLFVSLFPEERAQTPLASLLLNHYDNGPISLQHYAQRFLATLSIDLRDLRDLRDPSYPRDLRYPHYVRDMNYLRYLRNLIYMRDPRYLKNLSYLRDPRDIRYLRDPRDLVLTQALTRKAISRLSPANVTTAGYREQIDLLAILLGRELHIVEDLDEVSDEVEGETRQIVQAMYAVFTRTKSDEVREAALDIVRYLPARSANEIEYVLGLAKDMADARIQKACADALEFAIPKTDEAWDALALGKGSGVEAVRKAVEGRLKRRR